VQAFIPSVCTPCLADVSMKITGLKIHRCVLLAPYVDWRIREVNQPRGSYERLPRVPFRVVRQFKSLERATNDANLFPRESFAKEAFYFGADLVKFAHVSLVI